MRMKVKKRLLTLIEIFDNNQLLQGNDILFSISQAMGCSSIPWLLYILTLYFNISS